MRAGCMQRPAYGWSPPPPPSLLCARTHVQPNLNLRPAPTCRRSSSRYCSRGRLTTTPSAPLTQAYNMVGRQPRSGQAGEHTRGSKLARLAGAQSLTSPAAGISSPESGSRLTSDPGRKRLTNSPKWYCPTVCARVRRAITALRVAHARKHPHSRQAGRRNVRTSSLPRSSSVAASLFLRTVNRLYEFSAPSKGRGQGW